jgi:hypothetical protein
MCNACHSAAENCLFCEFSFDRLEEVFSVPEAGGSNIEVAQQLREHEESSQSLGHEILEIAEAVVLGWVVSPLFEAT